MEVVKFTLSGKTAFFKNPEVNSHLYFTFGQIHKVALFGLFGAILGLKGYNEQGDSVYPEFYEMLQELKVAVVPKNEKGYIPKKIQQFNNSVGYASFEQGGNLIVREQWMENPVWDIYFIVEDEVSKELAKALEQGTCVYIPYLGKNDHPANISNVIRFSDVKDTTSATRIHSLFQRGSVTFAEIDWDEFEDDITYKYEESLPIRIDEILNLYEYEKFIYTNLPIASYEGKIYVVNETNICFF